jgi:bla regulator protein blaR1
MTNELVKYLLSLTLASSAGIAAVLLLRRPARHVFGCRASYSLWLLVPVAMLAGLLPHTSSSVSITWRIESVSALEHALGPASHASGHPLNTSPSIDWRTLMLSVWCAGAALFAAYLAAQQRAFVKSLGGLSGSRCVLRSARSNGCPALLGVLRPKIILPVDFKFRYTRLERLLILSHERTHLRRGDAACNAFVALLRCIFWFNPLVHLASNCLRVDQEFACDAAVMRD